MYNRRFVRPTIGPFLFQEILREGAGFLEAGELTVACDIEVHVEACPVFDGLLGLKHCMHDVALVIERHKVYANKAVRVAIISAYCSIGYLGTAYFAVIYIQIVFQGRSFLCLNKLNHVSPPLTPHPFLPFKTLLSWRQSVSWHP